MSCFHRYMKMLPHNYNRMNSRQLVQCVISLTNNRSKNELNRNSFLLNLQKPLPQDNNSTSDPFEGSLKEESILPWVSLSVLSCRLYACLLLSSDLCLAVVFQLLFLITAIPIMFSELHLFYHLIDDCTNRVSENQFCL